MVTISVAGGDAAALCKASQHFTVRWGGCDIGHGVVSHGAFTSGSPS